MQGFGQHSWDGDRVMRVMQEGMGARWGAGARVGAGVTYSQPEPHIAGVFTSAASSMTPSPQHSSSLLPFQRQDAI